jgi:hypothetical protein
MTASTTHTSSNKKRNRAAAAAPSPAAAALTLDDLLDLAPDQLRVLYEGASVPELGDVHGDLEGRMLASPLLGRRLADGVRALARSTRFPWRGKSFTPSSSSSEVRGEGINRVFTDRTKWFRFETFIGRSLAGDFDALKLDYDLPENPLFIRIIQDEIRTLRPGLWLGQAYVVARGKTTLALYFALADRADRG